MYETRKVSVGRLVMGGHNPVWVQSMTNTDTRDVEKTLAQIRALHAAGCDLVRVSVYDVACAKAVRDLVDGSPCPLVADIHFDHTLAIMAAENGISKLRINPRQHRRGSQRAHAGGLRPDAPHSHPHRGEQRLH